MSESDFELLVRLHLEHSPLYYDAKLRAKHLVAVEKACEKVRDMPASWERVAAFEKAYRTEIERSKENDRSRKV